MDGTPGFLGTSSPESTQMSHRKSDNADDSEQEGERTNIHLLANSFAAQSPLQHLVDDGQRKPDPPFAHAKGPNGSHSPVPELDLEEEMEQPHVPQACVSPTCGGRLVQQMRNTEGSARFRSLLRLLLEEHVRQLAAAEDGKKRRKGDSSQNVRVEDSNGCEWSCSSPVTKKNSRPFVSTFSSASSQFDIDAHQDFFGFGEETGDESMEDHGSMSGTASQKSRRRRSQGGNIFVPRSAWLYTDEDDDDFALQSHSKLLIQHGATSHTLESRAVERDPNSLLQPLISLPGSSIRVSMDCIGAFFIFYDLIIIPLQAFGISDTLGLFIMDWLALTFWTLNMFASPFVGYVADGITVIVPLKTIVHYFKTWFLLDLITILPDWVFSVVALKNNASDNAAHSSVRLLRILRLMRMVRLARVLQLSRIMDEFDAMIDSEYISIVLRVFKMIVYLLIINHIVACVWYACAHLAVDSEDVNNWVDAHGFRDSSTFYLYWTSLHWSLTQFTPASMHVQPQNKVERIFAVLVVVFALVVFSYLVGSITGSLTQLRSMQENASKQFTNLRRYLRQQKVAPLLRYKLEKYLEHEWQRQQEMLSLKDVTIVKLLSDQLHGELQCALCVPHLSIHPLFSRLESASKVTLFRLSNTAISRKMLAAGDSLFLSGEMATHMYVCIEGRLRYIKTQKQSEGEGKRMEAIGSYVKNSGPLQRVVLPATEWVDSHEDWIAEPILWTPAWRHLGQTISHMKSELLLVDAEKFSEVILLNPQAMQLAHTYAKNFLVWLNTMDPLLRSDISQGEIISKMLERFMDMELDDGETMEEAMSKATTNRSLTMVMDNNQQQQI